MLLRYNFTRALGTGSFGKVFRGCHLLSGREVAIKVEEESAPNVLAHETKLLYYLQDRGCRNVPEVEWWSTVVLDTVVYRALVMTLLEMSVAEAAVIVTPALIQHWVREMIRILYQVHEAGIVHRDVKPQNFMLRNGIVYLIDFGLASVYVDDEFRGHLPANPGGRHEWLVGTPKYVSLFVHDGHDPSRRDDLISVGYAWLFLQAGGKLPWDDDDKVLAATALPPHHILHAANQHRKRGKQQLAASPYLDAVYRLEYDETPDYEALSRLITT